MDGPKRTVGARKLAAYRDRAAISQTDMAELLGMSQSHLSLIESGARQPGRDHIRRINEKTRGEVAIEDWFIFDGDA